MLVSEFRAKAILLYQAAVSGDGATALLLLWELVGALIATNPVGMLASLRGVQGVSVGEDELLAQLKSCCDSPPVAGHDDAKLDGAFVDLMRPILIALLKKWLGL